MKCHGCASSMLLERQEIAGRVITQWHRCPVCNKMHMHSERRSSSEPVMDWHDAQESGNLTGTSSAGAGYAPRQGIEYA